MTQLWIPITNHISLAHLGKLGEEAGELSAAVSRCIIQGMDGAEPRTGKINRQWLTEELADVNAAARAAVTWFDLDRTLIYERVARKIHMKDEWHQMLREALQ